MDPNINLKIRFLYSNNVLLKAPYKQNWTESNSDQVSYWQQQCFLFLTPLSKILLGNAGYVPASPTDTSILGKEDEGSFYRVGSRSLNTPPIFFFWAKVHLIIRARGKKPQWKLKQSVGKRKSAKHHTKSAIRLRLKRPSLNIQKACNKDDSQMGLNLRWAPFHTQEFHFPQSGHGGPENICADLGSVVFQTVGQPVLTACSKMRPHCVHMSACSHNRQLLADQRLSICNLIRCGSRTPNQPQHQSSLLMTSPWSIA